MSQALVAGDELPPNGVTAGLWSSTAPWKISSVAPVGSWKVMTSSTRRASASSRDRLDRDAGGLDGLLHAHEGGVVANLPAMVTISSVSPGTTVMRAERSSIRR